MRRVLLRTAALGTVVVLGLIAIAQAQRSVPDAPPPADELASGTGNLGMGNLGAGNLNNPLRNDLRSPEPITARAAGGVVLTDYQSPTSMNNVSAEPPVRMPSADPFGFRADGGETEPSVPAHSTAPEDLVADSSLSGFPAPRFGDEPYYGNPAPTAMAAAGAPGDYAATSNAGSIAYDDYGDVYRDPGGASSMAGTTTIGEPGVLDADPYAAPAGFSPRATQQRPAFLAPTDSGAPLGNALAAGEGTGQPGSQQLEGPQSPQLTIQKSAPATIQVGKPAKFRITVRNSGQAAAQQVEIRDEVPKGSRLIGTTPRASRGASGELVWNVGTLRAGEETSVEMDLEPIAEGEIGSVATVRFQADASARTVVTKPELVLKTSAPRQVLAGEEVTLSIEVSNPGSGTATGVVIEERVPVGLQHPAGPALEYDVGDLPPGESRTLELTLVADQPGPVVNLLTASADGNLRTEERVNLEIVSPLLRVAVAGPARRYLDREATYQLSVQNPGTASAEQVELVAYLSDGLEFVRANNSGQYVEASRTVHWRLEELPTSAAGTVELVTLPVEAGRQSIRVHGAADRGISADDEHAVLVEGITALTSVVVDVDDPIEVGGETTYEVRVLNQGSKAATNVQLAVQLPPEMRPLSGEGPSRYAIDGNRVLFEGLPRLAPKADVTYRIRAQGIRPGDLRVRVQLLADEMRSPVVKEESTRVYSDE